MCSSCLPILGFCSPQIGEAFTSRSLTNHACKDFVSRQGHLLRLLGEGKLLGDMTQALRALGQLWELCSEAPWAQPLPGTGHAWTLEPTVALSGRFPQRRFQAGASVPRAPRDTRRVMSSAT